jgi:hypothetical protein
MSNTQSSLTFKNIGQGRRICSVTVTCRLGRQHVLGEVSLYLRISKETNRVQGVHYRVDISDMGSYTAIDGDHYYKGSPGFRTLKDARAWAEMYVGEMRTQESLSPKIPEEHHKR